jgi:hypothetical protein
MPGVTESRRPTPGFHMPDWLNDVIRPVPPGLPLHAGLDASHWRIAVLPWLEPSHPPDHAPRR